MVVKKEGEALLGVARKAIEKEYGPVIKWLGEAAEQEREFISTGCLGLDNAVGKGGLERGLIAEFFGSSGAGKSFLGYSLIKQASLKGLRAAIIDAENSLDAELLINIGLPKDTAIVDGAPTGEDNLTITDMLMQTGQFAIVMIDSVAALVPKARVEDDYDQQTMGLHARLMSAGVQKIQPVAKKTNTLLVFINQLRNKIGSYGGNPQVTTGGETLGYYASYRIEVIGSPKSKSRRLVDPGTGELYGHHTTFRVVKNKRAAPYREAEVDLIYGIGYDGIGEIIDLSVDVGLIDKGGSWLTYGENKWQGRDRAKLALMSDPKLVAELEGNVRKIISGVAIDLVPPAVLEEPTPPKEKKSEKPVSKKRTRSA